MKYCDLINVLLTAEAHSELLIKNFNMRPAGTQAQPEAHTSFCSNKGKGPFRNKGAKHHGHRWPKGGKFKKHMNNRDQKSNGNGKGKSLQGSKGNANGAKHSNEGCFRRGSKKYWSRTCIAEPHLIELYQEWKKHQNPEAHFVQVAIDANTRLHLLEPLNPLQIETAAMDVDRSAAKRRHRWRRRCPYGR
jgi:hypothetical protein